MTCEMRELGVVKIARPCPARWSKMEGDAKVRFCNLCGLDVYNLSQMTADEAREVIREREEGRLCVRFWTRRDGTVMTRDCPRRDFDRAWAAKGGFAVAIALLLWFISLFSDNLRRLRAMSGQLALTAQRSEARR